MDEAIFKERGRKKWDQSIGRHKTEERRLSNGIWKTGWLSCHQGGVESREMDKDALVKKLRANIEAINNRLKVIDASEMKTAELARMKVEKAAAALKEPEADKEAKRQRNPLLRARKKRINRGRFYEDL